MASAIVYNNGIGATTGHDIVTADTAFWALSGASSNGAVFYVGPGGTDAVAPAGFRREAPLATLAQAHTNASAGDKIILLPNHVETLASAQTFNKANITVVSEGVGANRARFICGGSINMFDVTAAGVEFLNIYFPASTVAPSAARIRTAAAGTILEDCQFDCGAADTVRAIQYLNGASYAQIRGTTFTATAAGSIGAFIVDSGATMAGLLLRDVTVDGGSFGWTSTSIQVSGTLTGVKGLRVNLLNNSDAYWGSAPTGYVSVGVTSGSSYMLQG